MAKYLPSALFMEYLFYYYVEIPPVPVLSDEAGEKALENLATETFRKIKQDVTRHRYISLHLCALLMNNCSPLPELPRYGDDAHLDSTLEALGLKLPQKKYPKLLSLQQVVFAQCPSKEQRLILRRKLPLFPYV